MQNLLPFLARFSRFKVNFIKDYCLCKAIKMKIDGVFQLCVFLEWKNKLKKRRRREGSRSYLFWGRAKEANERLPLPS